MLFRSQEYTVFIGKPVYPRQGLTEREQVSAMREENFAAWKSVYEEFYGIALEYE